MRFPKPKTPQFFYFFSILVCLISVALLNAAINLMLSTPTDIETKNDAGDNNSLFTETISTNNLQTLKKASVGNTVEDTAAKTSDTSAKLISEFPPNANNELFSNDEGVFTSLEDESRFIKSDEIDELVDVNGKKLFIKEPAVSHFQDADVKKLAFEHSQHTVEKNESLWAIAKGYGISVDSIITANSIKRATQLSTGKRLEIPQFSGVYHEIKRGDTLLGLSSKYRTPLTDIKKFNNLPGYLRVGTLLFLPNAELSAKEKSGVFGTLFSPPVKGRISSPYGLRKHPILGKMLFHTGTDIAVKKGTSVRAIAGGKVTFSGSNDGYGNYVVIQHSGNYESLYAHLSKRNVKKGNLVKRGTIIGKVGTTGLSTGPHLHLEIKKNKRFINPQTFFNFKKPQKLLVYTH